MYSYDYLVITSTKYYEEIVYELIQQGINMERIVSLKDFLCKCILDSKELQYLRGRGVDVGEPSTTVFGNI